MTRSLYAVNPLDGRHSTVTSRLSEYGSEAALIRTRVRVEIEYLVALSELENTDLELDNTDKTELRELYTDFGTADAKIVKKIETEGHEQFEATNHDVKAVEYFIRCETPERLQFVVPWIHLGLTSEDVNNLSHRLLTRDAVEEVVLPDLEAIRERLSDLAMEFQDLPMLGRTHGQPATPTTFGKEMAVYVSRLDRSIDRIEGAVDGLAGKINGATGTYSAQLQAYPSVDWREFGREFVSDFGFEYVEATTQVNPCDDLAELLDALRGTNNILLDLVVDSWQYISDEYLGQEPAQGAVGSSTMPHKINPIDFEIAEGNLSKANSDFQHITNEITNSRYQRDLSDAPAKRHIAAALASSLVGYERTKSGLEDVSPNVEIMRRELAENPVVLAEAIQTVLRRAGHRDAYERVRDLTRGEEVPTADIHALIDDLDIDESVRNELSDLSPEEYTGLADTIPGEVR